MSSWFLNLDRYEKETELRGINSNNSVVTRYSDIETMIDGFDKIFGSIIDFNEEIANILLFPLNIPVIQNPSGQIGYLHTNHGLEDGGFTDVGAIFAWKVNYEKLRFHMGVTKIQRKFNNFADYNGYTTVSVFLPYVGFVDLDTNEVMDKYVWFTLYLDVYTGVGTYVISVTDLGDSSDGYFENARVISTIQTQLGIQIPTGSSNVGDIARNMIMYGIKTTAAVATKGLSLLLPDYTTTTERSYTTKTYDIKGKGTSKGSRTKQIKSGTVTTDKERTKTTETHSPSSKIRPFTELFSSGADALNRMFGSSATDRIDNTSGLIGLTTHIHIIIRRPRLVQTDFTSLFGKPVGKVGKLSQYHGYTEVDDIRYENMPCNFQELQMLDEVLSGGIIAP